MASTKTWEHGQLSLHNMSLAVDHGMATAMTRVGILGAMLAGSGTPRRKMTSCGRARFWRSIEEAARRNQ
eukprot:scaffold91089_cov18-Tisochrysis_lutea.AAC.1